MSFGVEPPPLISREEGATNRSIVSRRRPGPSSEYKESLIIIIIIIRKWKPPPYSPPPRPRLCRRNARGFETTIADIRGARFFGAAPALGSAYSSPSAIRDGSDRPGTLPSPALAPAHSSSAHWLRGPRHRRRLLVAVKLLMARRRSHTCAVRELSPGQPCGAGFKGATAK